MLVDDLTAEGRAAWSTYGSTTTPLAELVRLLDLHDLYFGKPDPETLMPLDGALADEVRDRLTRLGHDGEDLEVALTSWAGIENYEARLFPGKIDPLILDKLRAAS